MSGGKPVAVEGTDLPLWGMEIDPDEAKEEFRASLAVDGGEGAKGFMQGMGLSMVVEQLADLKLGELLDTPPPGLDESVAIAKVRDTEIDVKHLGGFRASEFPLSAELMEAVMLYYSCLKGCRRLHTWVVPSAKSEGHPLLLGRRKRGSHH